MTDEKRGSGVTFRSIAARVAQSVAHEYHAELAKMIAPSKGRGGFTKKQVDDMAAGAADGAAGAIRLLEKMGIIAIHDDVEDPS